MAAIESYLEFERLRFGDRLRATVEVEAGLGDLWILPMLLQPLVENAVSHGLSKRRDGGRVAVQVKRAGDRLAIMQKGYTVEMGPARPILDAPEHPYSRLLKESVLSIDDVGTDALASADRSEATAALERAGAGTLQEREDGRLVRM